MDSNLSTDLENNQPLLDNSIPDSEPKPASRRLVKGCVVTPITSMMVLCVVILSLTMIVLKKSVAEKLSRLDETTNGLSYPWTMDMLMWQRSGFHFQPQKNWMNDPNGPLYHKGYYHFFYQYNPYAATFGNMTWGHAVSKDLIHWEHLPFAMVPDHWYDVNGVWTGSATIMPDGNIMMLYTGGTHQSVQILNLAYPANLSDPLLHEWVKYPGNPVVTPPEGIGSDDFRDPTTAWVDHDGVWRFIIGSKKGSTGLSLVHKTRDFKTYELEGNLHGVPGTGMWECVDFFPVSTKEKHGLDTSAYGPGIKHFLKASVQDFQQDHYALGTYDMATQTWTPDDPEMDVGIGLRLDYGKFYAAKSFFDPHKQRRILWGWVRETDTEADDVYKGWASMQAIPRVVTYDTKTGTNILQWPVEELESLRKDYKEFDRILLHPGSIIDLNISSAAQLDVSAEFVIDPEALKSAVGDDLIENCSAAAVRQALGPFGFLVLADEALLELTPVYFYVAKASDGTVKNWVCTDQSRSSMAIGIEKELHSGPVTVLKDETYHMRLLIDHSIVEAFGQGGRTCITSRTYPTRALDGNARIFLFNNATHSSVTASVNMWRLDSS